MLSFEKQVECSRLFSEWIKVVKYLLISFSFLALSYLLIFPVMNSNTSVLPVTSRGLPNDMEHNDGQHQNPTQYPPLSQPSHSGQKISTFIYFFLPLFCTINIVKIL